MLLIPGEDLLGEIRVDESAAMVVSSSQKMDELAQRVENCHDPKELCSLFKSIKQCANAIQACIEVNKAMR